MTFAERAAAFLAAGVLGPVELHTVSRLCQLAGVSDPDIALGLAFAVRAPRVGHVGVDLRTLEVEADGLLAFPADRAAWMDRTVACPLVGPDRPFVHVAGLLTTRRYDDYQRRVAAACARRATTLGLDDPAQLHKQLDALFGAPRGGEPDLQRLAALVSVLRPLTVISGGPGTGKTYTVKKLLALLFQRHLGAQGVEPRVALAAPTGKAAARMQEAIGEGLEQLRPPRVRTFLRSLEPTTLHRLLGWDPRRRTRFRHDVGNPLPHDIVIVDEASMIDVALMAKLMDAVRPDARLVLLGDKNQLASVEAGSVLADLVSGAGPSGMRLPPELSARIREVDDMFAVIGLEDPRAPALSGGLVQLSRPYRFGAESGVGRLAHAIARGLVDEAVRLLLDDAIADISLAPFDPKALQAAIADGYAAFVRAAAEGAPPAAVLAAFEGFRVLTAHRRGPRGVEGLGMLARRLLHADPLAPLRARPLLVTENAAESGRWNGDIGVLIDGAAWFSGASGLERLPHSRLPPHEEPWAMTVHKAQGSQADSILLVLPERPSPIVTRELIYTAVTRARRSVRILGGEAVLRDALGRVIERASALPTLLAGAT